jgi:cyclophilin family peptidyl-prolyl cis-trans isomerase
MRIVFALLPGLLLAQPAAPTGAATSSTAPSQAPAPLTSADSALVGRILLAEDRRDSTDGALGEGERHADARVQALARRARGRIRDPILADRASLPPLRPSPIWAEPDWRVRYRAIARLRDDCNAMRLSLGDSAWAVRLRVMDMLQASCAGDDLIIVRLHQWVDSLPARTEKRKSGRISWHAGAHAIVALARLRPTEARRRIRAIAGHRQWEVREYVARAAVIVGDTALLRRYAADPNDNVAESAIAALSRMTGHADDALYLRAIDRQGAQVVRAAALALKGSPDPEAQSRALRAFDRLVARANQSERDARIALLDAAGRPPTADRPPASVSTLPPEAVALALGKEVYLKVTMARASGGGFFTIRLRGDNAPMMAARVLDLARRGYYDGLTWHRVEHDFVIQGLGPGANEYVGYEQYFRDELGGLSHLRGTVSMSTRGHDTGDAQWFVNLKDNVRLDRDYTVFAEVVDGIDTMDGILEGDRVAKIRRVPNGTRAAGARGAR